MKLADFHPQPIAELVDTPLKLHPDPVMTGKAKRQATNVYPESVVAYSVMLNDKAYVFVTMETKDGFFEVHFQEKGEKVNDSGADVPTKVFATAIHLYVEAFESGKAIRISAQADDKKKFDL